MKLPGLLLAALLAGGAYADDEAKDDDDEATRDREVAAEELERARELMESSVAAWTEAIDRLWTDWTDRDPGPAFLGVLVGDQSEAGLEVAGVTPAGGAEDAGIRADDVIVEINGERLTGRRWPLVTLNRALEKVSPGDPVTVVIARDGDRQPFEVVTTSYDDDARTGIDRRALANALTTVWGGQAGPVIVDDHIGLGGPNLRPGRFLFDTPDGLRLVDIGADLGDYFGVDGGVLVLNTPAGSELKPGDILRRINGADIASAAEAYRLLWRRPAAKAEAEDAEIEVRRKNRTLKVTMPVIVGDVLHHDTDVKVIKMEVDKQ